VPFVLRRQHFTYAVYRLGRTELSQVYEPYRRRFCIETGYRQLHQVRARTASRHPGLRLLLFGLAVLLVNYCLLLRQSCGSETCYGHRLRPVVVDESLVDLESLLPAREMGYTGVALRACKASHRRC
jgi:hypothetical protein